MPDRTQNVLVPLPCPFCGREPKMFSRQERSGETIQFIQCNESGHLSNAAADSVEEALAIWNTRATAPELPRVSVDLEHFRRAWNDNRGPLPQATKLTGERLQKLRSRIKEGLTLDEFTRAAYACSHTEFLLRGTPKQEFHSTFDWLVSNSGIVAKVLDGTYGPVGKTEAELRAEQATAASEAYKTDELMAHLSVRMAKGEPVPFYTERVQEWEKKARGILARVEMGPGGNVPPELAEIITTWSKRLSEVTTGTTATSGQTT